MKPTSPASSLLPTSPNPPPTMTRGRKKDLTLEPSRALAQQRDYRARKAQYVANLEERLRTVEAENAQLRQQLDQVKKQAATPPGAAFTPQTASASAELMQSLAAASSSLARFNELAFNHGAACAESSSPRPGLRPASFPSPEPSPPYIYAEASSPRIHTSMSSNKRPRVDSHSLPPISAPPRSPPRVQHPYFSQRYSRSSSSVTPSDRRRSISPVSTTSSDCCDGLIDCDRLIEDTARDRTQHTSPHRNSHTRSPSLPRSSGMRFSDPRSINQDRSPSR